MSFEKNWTNFKWLNFFFLSFSILLLFFCNENFKNLENKLIANIHHCYTIMSLPLPIINCYLQLKKKKKFLINNVIVNLLYVIKIIEYWPFKSHRDLLHHSWHQQLIIVFTIHSFYFRFDGLLDFVELGYCSKKQKQKNIILMFTS